MMLNILTFNNFIFPKAWNSFLFGTLHTRPQGVMLPIIIPTSQIPFQKIVLPESYNKTAFPTSKSLNPEPVRQFVKEMTESWTDERKGLAYKVTKGALGSTADNQGDTNTLEEKCNIISTNFEDPQDELSYICLTDFTLRDFINKQTNSIVYDDIELSSNPIFTNKYFEQNKIKQMMDLSTEHQSLLVSSFNNELKNIVIISVFLEEYSLRTKFYPFIEKSKIFIYFCYLICWTYILIISFHTLDFIILEELISYLPPPIDNPFNE